MDESKPEHLLPLDGLNGFIVIPMKHIILQSRKSFKIWFMTAAVSLTALYFF